VESVEEVWCVTCHTVYEKLTNEKIVYLVQDELGRCRPRCGSGVWKSIS
jgi:hypothetical protein